MSGIDGQNTTDMAEEIEELRLTLMQKVDSLDFFLEKAPSPGIKDEYLEEWEAVCRGCGDDGYSKAVVETAYKAMKLLEAFGTRDDRAVHKAVLLADTDGMTATMHLTAIDMVKRFMREGEE